jgi:DNA primase
VPGLIKRDDVDAVRERARIEEIVSAHVTLKPAGVGSLKGLCPFHDERTPSFTVRPAVGRFHCFGCGESGDVISFVQKTDGLGFTEAVEYLAARVGVELHYDDTGGGTQQRREEPGKRQRLADANRVAAEFYVTQLASHEAAAARKFLADRSFAQPDAERFGVGYAPNGWDALTRHLTGRGFTFQELLDAGLVSQGQRGVYDRFRGRLIWPIRDTTGAVVGFGARRLFEEDQGPKFLNTPETALYKKSQVLYGVDLAKKAIARDKRVVIVEGYADVMAMHLSGVETAVATCGTAFGSEHAKIIRRLMGDFAAGGGLQLADGTSLGGEVIFTFDGDAAGQAAAVRAFGEDQRFHAQTFVAVVADGMDPCDLRVANGPQAVRALVAGRVPLFEFVIRSALDRFDLETVEGRIGALRATAPLVAGIRDEAMRGGYTRELARWLGVDTAEVSAEVVRVSRARGRSGGIARQPGQTAGNARQDSRHTPVNVAGAAPSAAGPSVDPRDPVVSTERLALAAVVQYPRYVPAAFDEMGDDAFTAPVARAVHAAIRAAGGVASGRDKKPAEWVTIVESEAGPTLASSIGELAVLPLPEDRPDAIERYVADVVRAVMDLGLTRRIAEARGRLQRLDPADEGHDAAFQALLTLEAERRALRD